MRCVAGVGEGCCIVGGNTCHSRCRQVSTGVRQFGRGTCKHTHTHTHTLTEGDKNQQISNADTSAPGGTMGTKSPASSFDEQKWWCSD